MALHIPADADGQRDTAPHRPAYRPEWQATDSYYYAEASGALATSSRCRWGLRALRWAASSAASPSGGICGEHTGTLQVVTAGDQIRWTLTGDQGTVSGPFSNGWNRASVPLYSDAFLLCALRGNGYLGDMAIDAVEVECIARLPPSARRRRLPATPTTRHAAVLAALATAVGAASATPATATRVATAGVATATPAAQPATHSAA